MKAAVLILATIAAAAALPARAQGGASAADLRYCAALSDLYKQYVGNPETEPRGIRRNDAAVEAAMADCRRGDPATAIPLLERKLTENKISLPPRP